jgi:hypothetical protein
MPLKIQIAMSRKRGEPNYGSRGATVGLEMEEDASLVMQPQKLHERRNKLFGLAKEAVDRQLEGALPGCRKRPEADARQIAAVRSATPAQIRAIHAIVNSRQLELVTELQRWFDVERPDGLTVEQASQFIDALKQSSNGLAHLG